jgi:hypothetical protein
VGVVRDVVAAAGPPASVGGGHAEPRDGELFVKNGRRAGARHEVVVVADRRLTGDGRLVIVAGWFGLEDVVLVDDLAVLSQAPGGPAVAAARAVPVRDPEATAQRGAVCPYRIPEFLLAVDVRERRHGAEDQRPAVQLRRHIHP